MEDNKRLVKERMTEMIDKILDIYKAPNFAILAVSLIIIIFIVIVAIKLKRHDPNKPTKGILLLAEMLVNWTNNMCQEVLGSRWKKFAPYVLFEAMFLAVANLSGLLGLTPPTANICVPLALGLITGFVIHFAAIKYSGIKAYLKSYLDPFPLMLPINIFSELVTPISMGLRLFGNIFSGTMVMTLIYYVLGKIAIGVVPIGYILTPFITSVLHAVFDVFLGLIQVYVFMLLTVVFIAGKIPEEE